MKIKLPLISFEVTSECNLNCRYCYNHWKAPSSQKADFNSYTRARKTLKHLFQLADVDTISFTGGEPLLAKRFQELVLYTRLKKKEVTIISNGYYRDPAMYTDLAKLGVASFELPVHSDTPKKHDALTRVPGSWDRSTKVINLLLQNNARVVAVIVLTKINHLEIGNTLEYVKKLGIETVMLNRFNIGGEGIKHSDELSLTKSELETAFNTASNKAFELNLGISSNVCTPVCVLNPKDYRGIAFTSCSSDMTKRPLTLDAMGNMRFCNHSPVYLGTIFETPLQDILFSEKTRKWETSVPELCKDCSAFSYCKAGCRAASEQLGFGLDMADPLLSANK